MVPLTEVLQYRDHVVAEVERVQLLHGLQVLYPPDEVLMEVAGMRQRERSRTVLWYVRNIKEGVFIISTSAWINVKMLRILSSEYIIVIQKV